MHLYERHQGCLRRKGAWPQLPCFNPSPNSPLAELHSRILGSRPRRVSQPESESRSSAPLGTASATGLGSQSCLSQVEASGSLHSECLSPGPPTLATSRHSATEFSQMKLPPSCTASLSCLDLLFTQPTSFLSQHEFPSHALRFFTGSLHPASRTFNHLFPLSSHSLFFILPSPRLPIFFTSQMFLGIY